MEISTNYSCVIIYNPEKLLHINDKHLSMTDFKKLIRIFFNSENMNTFDFIYVYTKIKERISPIVNDVQFLDTIDCDEEIELYNPISIYYVRNDEETEKYLNDKFYNSSKDIYKKCDIKIIDISDNNEILLDTPDWIKNSIDASKDIDANVKFFDKNIYEIDKDFFLYAEREELEEIKKLVRLGKPFFVIGERGSGKTALIQNAVKAFSKRKGINDENFVAVACGTLRPELAASELFGHIAGSFTGAIEETEGYVQKANGGCLYLDEVQDLSKDIQRMLIKGIEEHVFYKVGSKKSYRSDFLLVCSSNKPLSEIKKIMYEDFYDRISVFQIKIPSIEERKKDKDFISKCLPGVWKNYKKDCSSPNQFCEYDQLDKYNLPGSSIKEKIIDALNSKDLPLRGNFRDIQKLLAYIELYALNEETQLVKGKSGKKEINDNIDDAIKKWKEFITERNSLLPDSIPSTITDDFLKQQNWKNLNKMFKSWVAEQAVRIYGSVNAAAQKLGVDKNVIRNNLPDEK